MPALDNRGNSPTETLRGFIIGYQITQAVGVAASLSIADLLADGSKTSDELAMATGTDPATLYRLLRALAAIGVFTEDEDRAFGLTPLGQLLRGDAPDSMRDWAIYLGRPYHWQAWTGLAESVRTGQNAFRQVHGTGVNDYWLAHLDENAMFYRAMTSQTRIATKALVQALDFDSFGTVVDIGGGQGSFLAALLTRYPALRGILFDQPHVVSGAKSLLDAARLSGRCSVAGGNYLEGVPAGGDAYLLKNVLEGHEDDDATTLLRNVRAVCTDDTRLLVIEWVIAPPGQGWAGKFSDLNMLVSPGGRNRTLAEFSCLLKAGGFTVTDTVPTLAGPSIVVARPA